MNFDEFCSKVKERILDFMPDSYGGSLVSVVEYQKQNDSAMRGLMIKKLGLAVTPRLELGYFYDIYKQSGENDHAFHYALSKIAYEYVKAADMAPKGITPAKVTNYDEVKDKITARFVNKERNEGYLEDKVTFDYLDLAVIFDINLESYEGMNRYISVTKEMADVWGISSKELYEQAVENESKTPYLIIPISSFFPHIKNVSPVIPDIPMVVATNKKKMHGFRVVLNAAAMKDISDRFGGDFYVIPSSVHEIIAVSADYFDKEKDIQAIKNMIYEINRTELKAQDFLSDELYAYDSEEMELVFAKELQDRRIDPER